VEEPAGDDRVPAHGAQGKEPAGSGIPHSAGLMAGDGVPAGYTQFFLGGARVVAAASVAPALRDALAGGTLHEFGARHPRARRLSGRGVAFAIPVALVTGGSVDVVIRHNRAGGML